MTGHDTTTQTPGSTASAETSQPASGNPKLKLAQARADKLALSFYEQLRDRPVADRRFVFRALISLSAPFASDARVDVASRALHACCQGHGDRSVSRREYDAWRAAQTAAPSSLPSTPEPSSGLGSDELPSATFIRSAFGSWTKALEALGYEAVGDARATGLRNHRAGWSRAELIAALRAFAPKDCGYLAQHSYRAAARAHNDAQPPGGRRYPLAQCAFLRVFGSWAVALAAAGLPVSPQAARLAGHTSAQARSTGGKAAITDTRILGTRADYTPTRVYLWLDTAARELKTNYLTMPGYDSWARQRMTSAAARGEVLIIPRAKTIDHRHGRWKNALYEAGLITAEERDRLGAGGFSYRDQDVLDGLRQALRHFQGPPSQAAYEAWRRELASNGSAPKGLGIATVSLVHKRFGTWSGALTRAAAGRPELEALRKRPTVPHLPKGGRWGNR